MKLLRLRDFRLLFIGQAASNWGDALTSLTLLIVTQRLTGSVTSVAGTAIAVALPQLLFGMVAGAYVDRWNRKTVMVVSDGIRGMLVLGFVFVDSPDKIWLLYTVAFAQSMVGAFFNPAKGAMIPRLIPGDELLAGNSLMETSRVVFGLLGTLVAGVYAGASTMLWPIFAIDAITFIGSAFFEGAIRTDGRAKKDHAEPSKVWHDMLEGFQALAASRTLIGVMVGGGVVMLGLGAVNVLLVPFVVDDLQLSESWFGLIEGAQVVAMVMAGALLTALAARLAPTKVVTLCLAGIGLVVASLALADNMWHLTLALFGAGWFVTPLQASVSTLIQSSTTDAVRGRIGAALGTVLTAASVTSMALAGLTAAVIGVRGVFAGAGVVALIAGATTVVLFKGVAAGEIPAPATVE